MGREPICLGADLHPRDTVTAMGLALPPGGRRPCKVCGAYDHDGRRHRSHVADPRDTGTGRPRVLGHGYRAGVREPNSSTNPTPRPRRRCKLCGENGHNRTTCRTVERVKKFRAGVQLFPTQEEIALRPRAVAPGARFIVTDDVREDERPRASWRTDDVWIAVAPTGAAVDGFDEWKLRRETDGKMSTGFPQVTPLFPCADQPRSRSAREENKPAA